MSTILLVTRVKVGFESLLPELVQREQQVLLRLCVFMSIGWWKTSLSCRTQLLLTRGKVNGISTLVQIGS